MRIIVAAGIAVAVMSINVALASAQKEIPNRPDKTVGWSIDQSKSPIDGRPQITATLKAVGYDAKMSLSCLGDKTQATFSRPSTYLGDPGSIKVLVRVGGIETMLYPSANGQNFYVGGPEYFIRRLPDNGTIFIAAAGDRGKTVSGEFKLGNVSKIRQKIEQACRS